MRKRLITPSPAPSGEPAGQTWINLENTALVEVTSEDPAYPVEAALGAESAQGWRAESAGMQTIRLLFDKPLAISRISLVFEESERERTQEFTLRWSGDEGRSFHEIVRQQWNFSPPATIREAEEYRVDLAGASVLELVIVPDKSRGVARASLKSLRLLHP